MYVRCDESSLYSRINYVHSPDESSAGVSGNTKRCTQGLARTRIVDGATPRCLHTEETGRYDLAWEDLCSVLKCLQ